MIKFEILGMDFYYNQFNLLKMCDYLHDIITGNCTSDTIEPYFVFEYLRHRLLAWRVEPNNEYSRKLYELIVVVVDDYNKYSFCPKIRDVNKYLDNFKKLYKREYDFESMLKTFK